MKSIKAIFRRGHKEGQGHPDNISRTSSVTNLDSLESNLQGQHGKGAKPRKVASKERIDKQAQDGKKVTKNNNKLEPPPQPTVPPLSYSSDSLHEAELQNLKQQLREMSDEKSSLALQLGEQRGQLNVLQKEIQKLKAFQEESNLEMDKLAEENTALRNRLRDVAHSPLSDNEKQQLLFESRHHSSAPASIATNVAEDNGGDATTCTTPDWDKHSSSNVSEVSVACLQDKINQMQETHYSTNEELQATLQELTDLQRQLTELQQENERLNEEKTLMFDSLCRQTERLNDSRQEVENLKQLLYRDRSDETGANQLESVVEREQKLVELLRSAQEEREQLLLKLEQMQAELQDSRAENIEKSESIGQQTERVRTLECTLDAKHAEHKQLDQELAQAKDQCSGKQIEINRLTDLLENARTKINELEQDRTLSDKSELDELLDNARKEKDQLESEVAYLKEQLARSKNEIEKLKEQVFVLQEECKVTRNNAKTTQSDLEYKCEKLVTEKNTLGEQLQQFQEAVNELQVQAQCHLEDKRQLSAVLSETQRNLSEAERRNLNLETEIQELKKLRMEENDEWEKFQNDLLTSVRVANDFKTEAQQELQKIILENKTYREKLRLLEGQVEKLKGEKISTSTQTDIILTPQLISLAKNLDQSVPNRLSLLEHPVTPTSHGIGSPTSPFSSMDKLFPILSKDRKSKSKENLADDLYRGSETSLRKSKSRDNLSSIDGSKKSSTKGKKIDKSKEKVVVVEEPKKENRGFLKRYKSKDNLDNVPGEAPTPAKETTKVPKSFLKRNKSKDNLDQTAEADNAVSKKNEDSSKKEMASLDRPRKSKDSIDSSSSSSKSEVKPEFFSKLIKKRDKKLLSHRKTMSVEEETLLKSLDNWYENIDQNIPDEFLSKEDRAVKKLKILFEDDQLKEKPVAHKPKEQLAISKPLLNSVVKNPKLDEIVRNPRVPTVETQVRESALEDPLTLVNERQDDTSTTRSPRLRLRSEEVYTNIGPKSLGIHKSQSLDDLNVFEEFRTESELAPVLYRAEETDNLATEQYLEMKHVPRYDSVSSEIYPNDSVSNPRYSTKYHDVPLKKFVPNELPKPNVYINYENLDEIVNKIPKDVSDNKLTEEQKFALKLKLALDDAEKKNTIKKMKKKKKSIRGMEISQPTPESVQKNWKLKEIILNPRIKKAEEAKKDKFFLDLFNEAERKRNSTDISSDIGELAEPPRRSGVIKAHSISKSYEDISFSFVPENTLLGMYYGNKDNLETKLKAVSDSSSSSQSFTSAEFNLDTGKITQKWEIPTEVYVKQAGSRQKDEVSNSKEDLLYNETINKEKNKKRNKQKEDLEKLKLELTPTNTKSSPLEEYDQEEKDIRLLGSLEKYKRDLKQMVKRIESDELRESLRRRKKVSEIEMHYQVAEAEPVFDEYKLTFQSPVEVYDKTQHEIEENEKRVSLEAQHVSNDAQQDETNNFEDNAENVIGETLNTESITTPVTNDTITDFIFNERTFYDRYNIQNRDSRPKDITRRSIERKYPVRFLGPPITKDSQRYSFHGGEIQNYSTADKESREFYKEGDFMRPQLGMADSVNQRKSYPLAHILYDGRNTAEEVPRSKIHIIKSDLINRNVDPYDITFQSPVEVETRFETFSVQAVNHQDQSAPSKIHIVKSDLINRDVDPYDITFQSPVEVETRFATFNVQTVNHQDQSADNFTTPMEDTSVDLNNIESSQISQDNAISNIENISKEPEVFHMENEPWVEPKEPIIFQCPTGWLDVETLIPEETNNDEFWHSREEEGDSSHVEAINLIERNIESQIFIEEIQYENPSTIVKPTEFESYLKIEEITVDNDPSTENIADTAPIERIVSHLGPEITEDDFSYASNKDISTAEVRELSASHLNPITMIENPSGGGNIYYTSIVDAPAPQTPEVNEEYSYKEILKENQYGVVSPLDLRYTYRGVVREYKRKYPPEQTEETDSEKANESDVDDLEYQEDFIDEFFTPPKRFDQEFEPMIEDTDRDIAETPKVTEPLAIEVQNAVVETVEGVNIRSFDQEFVPMIEYTDRDIAETPKVVEPLAIEVQNAVDETVEDVNIRRREDAVAQIDKEMQSIMEKYLHTRTSLIVKKTGVDLDDKESDIKQKSNLKKYDNFENLHEIESSSASNEVNDENINLQEVKPKIIIDNEDILCVELDDSQNDENINLQEVKPKIIIDNADLHCVELGDSQNSENNEPLSLEDLKFIEEMKAKYSSVDTVSTVSEKSSEMPVITEEEIEHKYQNLTEEELLLIRSAKSDRLSRPLSDLNERDLLLIDEISRRYFGDGSLPSSVRSSLQGERGITIETIEENEDSAVIDKKISKDDSDPQHEEIIPPLPSSPAPKMYFKPSVHTLNYLDAKNIDNVSSSTTLEHLSSSSDIPISSISINETIIVPSDTIMSFISNERKFSSSCMAYEQGNFHIENRESKQDITTQSIKEEIHNVPQSQSDNISSITSSPSRSLPGKYFEELNASNDSNKSEIMGLASESLTDGSKEKEISHLPPSLRPRKATSQLPIASYQPHANVIYRDKKKITTTQDGRPSSSIEKSSTNRLSDLIFKETIFVPVSKDEKISRSPTTPLSPSFKSPVEKYGGTWKTHERPDFKQTIVLPPPRMSKPESTGLKSPIFQSPTGLSFKETLFIPSTVKSDERTASGSTPSTSNLQSNYTRMNSGDLSFKETIIIPAKQRLTSYSFEKTNIPKEPPKSERRVTTVNNPGYHSYKETIIVPKPQESPVAKDQSLESLIVQKSVTQNKDNSRSEVKVNLNKYSAIPQPIANTRATGRRSLSEPFQPRALDSDSTYEPVYSNVNFTTKTYKEVFSSDVKKKPLPVPRSTGSSDYLPGTSSKPDPVNHDVLINMTDSNENFSEILTNKEKTTFRTANTTDFVQIQAIFSQGSPLKESDHNIEDRFISYEKNVPSDQVLLTESKAETDILKSKDTLLESKESTDTVKDLENATLNKKEMADSTTKDGQSTSSGSSSTVKSLGSHGVTSKNEKLDLTRPETSEEYVLEEDVEDIARTSNVGEISDVNLFKMESHSSYDSYLELFKSKESKDFEDLKGKKSPIKNFLNMAGFAYVEELSTEDLDSVNIDVDVCPNATKPKIVDFVPLDDDTTPVFTKEDKTSYDTLEREKTFHVLGQASKMTDKQSKESTNFLRKENDDSRVSLLKQSKKKENDKSNLESSLEILARNSSSFSKASSKSQTNASRTSFSQAKKIFEALVEANKEERPKSAAVGNRSPLKYNIRDSKSLEHLRAPVGVSKEGEVPELGETGLIIKDGNPGSLDPEAQNK